MDCLFGFLSVFFFLEKKIMPSSRVWCLWEVTLVEYGLASCVTWLVTWRMLTALKKLQQTREEKGGRSQRESNEEGGRFTRWFAAVVCVGFSLALPLQCVEEMFILQAYQNHPHSADKHETSVSQSNRAYAWAFGLSGTYRMLFFSLSLSLSLFLFVSRIFSLTVLSAIGTHLLYRTDRNINIPYIRQCNLAVRQLLCRVSEPE